MAGSRLSRAALVAVLVLTATAVGWVAAPQDASADHDVVNGCTLSPDTDVLGMLVQFDLDLLVDLYADDDFGLRFQAACNYHDLCYSTLGQDQFGCDNKFLKDLEGACRAAYLPGKDWTSWLRPWRTTAYFPCMTQVLIMQVIVRPGGWISFYDAAQDHAKGRAVCGPEEPQPVLSGIFLSTDWIESIWNHGCSRIVDVSYGDGEGGTGFTTCGEALDPTTGTQCATTRWTAVFSTTTDYAAQSYSYGPWSKIRAAYLAGWDDGYAITDLEHGAGKWTLVYSTGTGITNQSVRPPTSWDDVLGFIEDSWDAGFAVTDVEHGDDGWVVVVSEGTGLYGQRVLRRPTWDDVVDEFERKEPDRQVTDLEYGDGSWVMVLSRGTGTVSGLSWRQNFDATHKAMDLHRSEGYHLVDLEYGEGGYKYAWAAPVEPPSPPPPPANKVPNARDDEATIEPGQVDAWVSIKVLGNDSDPDGDDLTITDLRCAEQFESCDHVAWRIDSSGTRIEVRALNTAEDSYLHRVFIYTISDGRGGADSASVDVDIFYV